MDLRQSINTALFGYLDLFQLRTGGRNPQVTADYIQPTIDLQRWYLESRVSSIQGNVNTVVATIGASQLTIATTTPAGLSNGTNIVVPSNEVWILMPGTRLRSILSANAGISGMAQLGILQNGLNAAIPMQVQGWNVSDAAGTRAQESTLMEMFWCAPGAQITANSLGMIVPAGNISFGLTLRVVRLRV